MTKPPTRTSSSMFVRVELPGGGRFGPGKAELLRAIDRTGSISKAARSMRMSYRRAWLLVDSTSRSFGRPVVTAAPGGRQGGGATLTPFGRILLETYQSLVAAAARAARPALRRFDRWVAAGS